MTEDEKNTWVVQVVANTINATICPEDVGERIVAYRTIEEIQPVIPSVQEVQHLYNLFMGPTAVARTITGTQLCLFLLFLYYHKGMWNKFEPFFIKYYPWLTTDKPLNTDNIFPCGPIEHAFKELGLSYDGSDFPSWYIVHYKPSLMGILGHIYVTITTLEKLNSGENNI